MILQRYPTTFYQRKQGSTLEVKLPTDAANIRDFINQGTTGIFCYAETAGALLAKDPSVFLALKPGEETKGLPFVCTFHKTNYFHVYGPVA